MSARAIGEIDLDLVDAGDNDRTAFDAAALQELAQSMSEHGLAQPITVRPQDGRYQIVAGERRTRAARLLGWRTIPAIVQELSDEQAAAIMLAENVQRVDLNPMDEARAYQKRMDAFGWSVADCAKRANVSEDKVRARIRLLNLAPEIQALVSGGQMATGYAEALADLDVNRQRIAMRYFNEAKRPTVSEFRQLVGKLYAEQCSEQMFDLSAFLVSQVAGEDSTGDKGGLPVHPKLPPLRGSSTLGRTLERYLVDLLAAGDEFREAALVVSTVYDGLLRTGLARRPEKEVQEVEWDRLKKAAAARALRDGSTGVTG